MGKLIISPPSSIGESETAVVRESSGVPFSVLKKLRVRSDA
jgi:hypothetical protein